MTVTGLFLQRVASVQAEAPEGKEFKHAYFAEHATKAGLFLLDAYTDLETELGASELTEELKTVQLNAGTKFWAVLSLAPTGGLTKDSVEEIIEEVVLKHQVSVFGFFKTADPEFVSAVKNILDVYENQMDYFAAVFKSRPAQKFALSGVEATQSSGSLTIPLADHSFEVGEDLLFDGFVSLKGKREITAVAANVSVTIAGSQATVTFADGVTVEEHPDDYVMDFKDVWKDVFSDKISVVAPSSESNWLGAYLGRLAKIKVMVSAGKTADGPLNNVSVNPNYGPSQLTVLDSGRAVFFKQHKGRPEEVYVNDDNLLFSPSDTIKNMRQIRVGNKAAEQIIFYGHPLINNEEFNRDESGARAAGQIAAEGLDKMKDPDDKQPELGDYSLELFWITDGIKIEFSLRDRNLIKIVDTEVEFSKAEEA